MDVTSRRLAQVLVRMAALMTVMTGPARGFPDVSAPARLAERPAVAPLAAARMPASLPDRTAPALASHAPDDPPPLTPILDPAPLDPPPPLLIVERASPLSAAPAPAARS